MSGFSATYVGLDKVDLEWAAYTGEDFDSYRILVDGNQRDRIYDNLQTTCRVGGLEDGVTYLFRFECLGPGGSILSSSEESYKVGNVHGTLKIDDDTWTNDAVTLTGHVDLSDFELSIVGCSVVGDAFETWQIGEQQHTAGMLRVEDSSFENVGIDVSGNAHSFNGVLSNTWINVQSEETNFVNVSVTGMDKYGNPNEFFVEGKGNTLHYCGGNVRVSGDNTTVENCDLNMLYVDGKGTIVRKNVIQDSPGTALTLKNCQNSVVEQNAIINATTYEHSSTSHGTGISISDPGVNVLIAENEIYDTEFYGLYVESWTDPDQTAEDLLISDNTFEDTERSAIFIRNAVHASEIGNNTIVASGQDAISLDSGNGISIWENTISESYGGIYAPVTNSEIYDNAITNVENIGITIHGVNEEGNNSVYRNSVSNPDIEYENFGIDVEAPSSKIYENNVSQVDYGIYSSYSGYINITENTVSDIECSAIYVHENDNPIFIEGNTVTNGMKSNDDLGAVSLRYCTNVTVKGNLVEGGYRSVFLQSCGQGIEISSNELLNSTTEGIQSYSALDTEPPSYKRGDVGAYIHGNTISGASATNGIKIHYSDGIRIESNNVSGFSTGGYVSYGNGTEFCQNRFFSLTGTGIAFGTGTEQSDCIVRENSINTSGSYGITLNGVNTTVSSNTIGGYYRGGIVLYRGEENCIKENNFTRDTSDINSWDIVVDINNAETQETLVLEDNVLGVNHPTEITVSGGSGMYWLRGVENPPKPPQYPDYNTTQQDIGKWLEAMKNIASPVEPTFNLTFRYSSEDLDGCDEDTLTVWKYNGTAWDAGGNDIHSWNGTRWKSTEDNYVGVEILKFCIFAPLGGKPVHNFRSGFDFDTIQEAINDHATVDGDTIHVDPSYGESNTKENVYVSKEVSIQSSSGKAADVAVTASNANLPVFWVTSDNVLIDGFVISGATGAPGVLIAAVENADVKNCRLTGNRYGVQIKKDDYVGPSTYCTISDDTFESNTVAGVVINDSSRNNIYNSDFKDPQGVVLDGSAENDIQDDTFSECEACAIGLFESDGNTVKSCTISGSPTGVWVSGSDTNEISGITVSESTGTAIYLTDAENNVIRDDSIVSSVFGIYLEDSDGNLISGCSVSGDVAAATTSLTLDSSDENEIQACSFSNIEAGNYRITALEMKSGSNSNKVYDTVISGLASSLTQGVVIHSPMNEFKNISVSDLNGELSGATGIEIGEGVLGTWIDGAEITQMDSRGNTTGILLRSTQHSTIRNLEITGMNSTANTTSCIEVISGDMSDTFEKITIGDENRTTLNMTAQGDLKINAVACPPEDPDDASGITHYIAITNTTPSKLSLTVFYSDENLDGKDPRLLSMWRNDGSWKEVPGENGVDIVEKYVYAYNITELGIFAPIWARQSLLVADTTAMPAVIPTDTDGTPGWGEQSELSVAVTGTDAASVTVDLSELGGSVATAMTGAGNGTWSVNATATVPSPFESGAYLPVHLPVNATDTCGVSNTTASIPLTVVKNGDANEDYRVSLYDAVYTARHTLGMDGYSMTESVGEVSGEGTLSLHDAMYLAKHVLAIPGFELLH